MTVRGFYIGAWIAWALIGGVVGGAEPEPWRVPEGFTATLFADDDLATDVTAMTIDPRGRVVVAGPGYIKILHDDDHDGRADRATTFDKSLLPGAEALAYVENDKGLVVLAMLRAGKLTLLYDRNGDDQADERAFELFDLGYFKYIGHSLRAGPDGALYLACGAGEKPMPFGKYLSLRSPIRHTPSCGAVLRVAWQPDAALGPRVVEMLTGDERIVDVLADGFCDPHGLDFHPDGNLLTVDVDNETELGLPWYAPLRLFDVALGRHHGWQAQGKQAGWNRPAYFPDSIAPSANLETGVPSELVVYRHRQFPAHYRGGAFVARWDYGRVDYVPFVRDETTLRGKPEPFFAMLGDVGLAPSDFAVGPEGDLFIACGGDATRGAVIRVRHSKGHAARAALSAAQPVGKEPAELERILNADQPTAAWSRHVWLPAVLKLGAQPLFKVIADPLRNTAEQVRAVEILREVFTEFDYTPVQNALALNRPELSARLAWAMSGRYATDWQRVLTELTFAADARVQLAAWDGLRMRPPAIVIEPVMLPNWPAAESSLCDRRVRASLVIAAKAAVAGPPNPNDPQWQAKNQALLRLQAFPTTEGAVRRLELATTSEAKLRAVRNLQRNYDDYAIGETAANDPFPGYGLRQAKHSVALTASHIDALSALLPTGDADVDRELFRTLASFALPKSLFVKLADHWTADSDPTDDLHYLIVAATAKIPNTAQARSLKLQERTADALLGLDAKLSMRGIRIESEWSAVVERVYAALAKQDPEFPALLVGRPSFGRAAHAGFVSGVPPELRQVAAVRIFNQVAVDEATHWNPTLIDIAVSTGDPRVAAMLRGLWKDPSLQPALFPLLMREDRPEDLPKFVECLTSPRSEIVRRAAIRLQRSDVKHTAAELAAAVRGLRQMCTIPSADQAREALTILIGQHASKSFTIVEPPKNEIARRGNALRDAYQAVFLWYALEHYQAASAERSPDGVEPVSWRKRLLKVDWDEGDDARGRALFEKKQCHRCHMGGSRLGPDLDGAAGRYSRSELFATVFEPSRFVPPAYRPTTVELKNGRSYTGIPAHRSTGVVLLQTGAETTVRVLGSDVATEVESTKSIMPLGLLADLTSRDFADLYAYLASIQLRLDSEKAEQAATAEVHAERFEGVSP